MKIKVFFHQNKEVPAREVEAEEISAGGLKFHIHDHWVCDKETGRWRRPNPNVKAISRRGYFLGTYNADMIDAAEHIRKGIRAQCADKSGKVTAQAVIDHFLAHWEKVWMDIHGVDKLFLMQEEKYIRDNIKVAK